MVYGVLRFINFAHSDVMMLGAFAAYFLAPPAARFSRRILCGGLSVIVLAARVCAGWGF